MPVLTAASSGSGGSISAILLVLAVIAFFVLRRKVREHELQIHRNRLDSALRQYNARGPFDMGIAVAGLSNANGNPVICLINTDDLLFFPAPVNGRYPGRSQDPLMLIETISISSITGVAVEDKSSISLHTQEVMTAAETRQNGCIGCFGIF